VLRTAAVIIWKSFIYECESERHVRRWEWWVIKTMRNTTVPKLPTERRWCSHGGDYKHYGFMGYDCIRTCKHLPALQWYVLPPSTEHWVIHLSRWRMYLPLKHQYISIRLHGITTSMTAIFLKDSTTVTTLHFSNMLFWDNSMQL